jgi:3-ketosteroid 9alpha-monooxygenase subunit A
MATTKDYGLGEFTYPRGWFMIAASGDATKKPLPLRYFGEELVLYRGESGAPYLVEAYCPHMGAHIARTTTSFIVMDNEQVQGESIRCPFHGWRFGPDGQCNDVPYASYAPKAARLKTYSVVERAGIIWMWHDPEGGDADYPLPDFGDHYDQPGWVNWKINQMGDLDIHPVELVDNMADYGHMAPIHGAKEFVYFANVFQDHVVRQLMGSYHRTLATDLFVLDTWYTGPGILQSKMDGLFSTLQFVAHTPIDDGRARIWQGLMVRINDGSAPISSQELEMASSYQELNRSALAQDVEVWAFKKPCFQPMVVREDGPYGRVRAWYKQFYNPRARIDEYQARVNGEIVTLDKRPGGKDAA